MVAVEQDLAQPRGFLARLFGAILPVVLLTAACPGPAEAQAPPDLWQTYLDAAQASDNAGDFKTEAITLDAALAFASKHDPQGQRPALTRLPLVLAYGELHRTDLMDPLSALGVNIDVGQLDKRYNDYISTLDSFANHYYDRWNAHLNDSESDDLSFKQTVRFYGAKNLFALEIAFRTKLNPEDKIGLATAMGLLGLAYKKHAYYDCAGYDYAEASQIFRDFRQTLNAMETSGRLFDLGSQSASSAASMLIPPNLDTQVALLEAFERYMRDVADEALHPNSDEASAAKTDWDFCSRRGPTLKTPPAVGFDAQISRAIAYHDVKLSLIEPLRKYWSENMLFGTAEFQLAQIYKLEYQRSQKQAGAYPDALGKARSAYEDALKILSHAEGPRSQFVQEIAGEYADLLNDAKLPAEAKKIKAQYGVTASN